MIEKSKWSLINNLITFLQLIEVYKIEEEEFNMSSKREFFA